MCTLHSPVAYAGFGATVEEDTGGEAVDNNVVDIAGL